MAVPLMHVALALRRKCKWWILTVFAEEALRDLPSNETLYCAPWTSVEQLRRTLVIARQQTAE